VTNVDVQAVPDSVRDRVIAAALRLYKTRGPEAITFRRLAAELGISHMLPYRHFANKAELIASLRQTCFERLLAHIRRNDPGGHDPFARLEAITQAVFTYIGERPEEYRLMFSLSQPRVTDYPELLAVREALFGHLLGIVRQAVDAGQIRGDPSTVLHLAWATAHGLFTLHVSHQLIHGRALDELVAPAIESIFAPFRAGTAATG